MVSIVFSSHYWDIGKVKRKDGTYFKTEKGAFKNHPCTIWAAAEPENLAWLIQHGCALTQEYWCRYGKVHGLADSMFDVKKQYHNFMGSTILDWMQVEKFTRAMPDIFKLDDTIDTVEAYRRFVSSKVWPYNNYLRIPSRRPQWLTQS